MPKGSGRAGGQFGEKPGASISDGNDEAATIEPAFFDPRAAERLKPPEPIKPLLGPQSHPSNAPSLGIDIAPVPLPLPFPESEADDEDGPACPQMRPDRSGSNDPRGQWEEFRLSLLINHRAPTPKKTPAQPSVTSMTYYFQTGRGAQEVAIDDCKRTSEPSPIEGSKKGDMVEVKTEGSAALIASNWGSQASVDFDKQFNNQIMAIRLEGKGRSLYVCVGSKRNAVAIRDRYAKKDYEESRFTTCP